MATLRMARTPGGRIGITKQIGIETIRRGAEPTGKGDRPPTLHQLEQWVRAGNIPGLTARRTDHIQSTPLQNPFTGELEFNRVRTTSLSVLDEASEAVLCEYDPRSKQGSLRGVCRFLVERFDALSR